jgi:myo-inositol-1(or 4)-monophosphatase
MGSLSREVQTAARAAELGGSVVRAAGLGGDASAQAKGLPGDYVTETDVAAERAIIELLSAEGGGVGVHGEESGGADIADAWVVDPLDGTTNFAHGFPAVGVSVALVREGMPVAGAVCAPFLGDTWVAGRGEGAWRVRESGGSPARLAVSRRDPGRAVVATGFPFRRKDLLPRYLRTFEGALALFEDLRRPGAASLDLAWVASGVFDGFFELALAPWDVAAGGLLISEAGGVVTDWTGGDGWLRGDILGGGAAVHAALRALAAEGA